MGKIEDTLKSEISRLAKKEIKIALADMQNRLRSLSTKVRQLEKDNAKLLKTAVKPAVIAPAATPKTEKLTSPQDKRKMRFSASMLKRFRSKANLTQAQAGKLLGVSMGAIVNWEKNISSPRTDSRVKFAQLRKMSPKQLKTQLESLGITGRKRKASRN